MATYLLNKADNDNVYLFDIRGTAHPDDLRQSLLEISLTSELTKSDKGLYHVQICPAIGADKKMTRDDWLRAVEILEEETGFTNQKRALVMHEKAGRLHLHVVLERYDHELGIMKSDSFSRLAQDRARQRMEIELEQERTPKRNAKQPVLKAELTKLWHETNSPEAFMNAVNQKGYAIAAGTQRPYMLIDDTGRSFDLVRQLAGVKTKAVADRLRDVKLVNEKEAIAVVRFRQARDKFKEAKQHIVSGSPKEANDNNKAALKQKALDKMREARFKKARNFRDNDLEMTL